MAGGNGDGAPLLDCAGLTLQFGGVTALSDVTFHVEPGELFAIIGPNGAGKTSIFNCINQVYRPQKGSLRLNGVELVGRRPPDTARLGVARTFQNLGLFPHLDPPRQPDARPPPPHADGIRRRRHLVGPGPAGGDRAPGPLRGDRRPARVAALPGPAGRSPPLRRPEADRARPGAGHGADACSSSTSRWPA